MLFLAELVACEETTRLRKRGSVTTEGNRRPTDEGEVQEFLRTEVVVHRDKGGRASLGNTFVIVSPDSANTDLMVRMTRSDASQLSEGDQVVFDGGQEIVQIEVFDNDTGLILDRSSLLRSIYAEQVRTDISSPENLKLLVIADELNDGVRRRFVERDGIVVAEEATSEGSALRLQSPLKETMATVQFVELSGDPAGFSRYNAVGENSTEEGGTGAIDEEVVEEEAFRVSKMVIGYTYFDNNTKDYFTMEKSGDTWAQPALVVSHANALGNTFLMALSNSGQPVMSYRHPTAANVKFSRRSTSGTWSDGILAEILDGSTTLSKAGPMTSSFDGSLYSLYHSTIGMPHDLTSILTLSVRSNDQLTTFPISSSTTENHKLHSDGIAIDGNNVLHMSYGSVLKGGANTGKVFYRSLSGSTLRDVELVMTLPSDCVGELHGPNMYLDRSGNPHFVCVPRHGCRFASLLCSKA